MFAKKLLRTILEMRIGASKVKLQSNWHVLERKITVNIKHFSAHMLTLGPIAFINENKKVLINLLSYRRYSTTDANKISYNSPAEVEGYAQWDALREPEKKILDLRKRRPPFRRMLDIGVGGGRTAKYFTEIAKEYIGIDYSEKMIEACRKKFQKLEKASFAVIDARDLSVYEDDYFDFVLCSHGGLDAVEDEDRKRILHEIWRVTKKGGCLYFSSGNLDAMFQFCRVKLSKNPKVFAKMLSSLLLVRLLNPEMWKHARSEKGNVKHTMFNFGGHKWSLKTYCIEPEAQCAQLKKAGFDDVRIFDLQGKEIRHLPNTTSIELYYLCNTVKSD
jgi:ubiquinone/menaquinone biosynthesis C-methylase UbiE